MGLMALAERMTDLEQRLEDSATTLSPEDVAAIDRDFDQEAGSLRAFAAE
jgi:hypothetical protein